MLYYPIMNKDAVALAALQNRHVRGASHSKDHLLQQIYTATVSLYILLLIAYLVSSISCSGLGSQGVCQLFPGLEKSKVGR